MIEELVITRLRTLTQQPALRWNDALPMIRRIDIHAEAVLLHLVLPEHSGWRDHLAQTDTHHIDHTGKPVITIRGKLRLRGGRTLLLPPSGQQPTQSKPDRALIAGLRRAHAELVKHNINIRSGNLDQAKGFDDPYLRKLVTLAFLAPDIQKAILTGCQPAGLRLADLLANPPHCAWVTQKRDFGF